jgi:hypothetical protein
MNLFTLKIFKVMMYYLVKYEFEVTTKKDGKVKLGCLEVMNEHRRHYALEYIDDKEIYSVKADVGEDEWEEIWVDIDEVRDAIDGAMEISEEDYEAFQCMFEGTTYGQIGWDDLEILIDEEKELEEEDEDEEEDEWEAAARECW